MPQKKYELQEVVLRLKKGRTLYADQPMNNVDAAVAVMQQELANYDREVLCVVNLDTKLRPINFNIVSVGNLSQTIADIPYIVRSALYANAASQILLHCHPSGDPAPSAADVELTRRVVEAGRLIGIPCVDHIIVGCGTGRTCSLREQGFVDFGASYRNESAEEILKTAEEPVRYERKGGTGMDRKTEEISIKFGKGLAKPFTGKNGKEYLRILIPHEDPGDRSPWDSFVLPAKAVHENQYGKGLWAKIPAEGKTTVTKSVLIGEQDGKRIWDNQRIPVPNRQLKARVEAYKRDHRESALGQLSELSKKAAEQRPEPAKTKARKTEREK